MVPDKKVAERLLAEAVVCNPGPWEGHSRVAARCAEKIAMACPCIDPAKAYVLGLLHDIGRKFGFSHFRHVYDGYVYMSELGYDEVAKICLTHSFCIPDINIYIGEIDVTEEQRQKVENALKNVVYDDYDYLIQLCDCLAGTERALDLEVRMAEVKQRYGYYLKDKWEKNLQLKKYFEKKTGRNIYEIVK